MQVNYNNIKLNVGLPEFDSIVALYNSAEYCPKSELQENYVSSLIALSGLGNSGVELATVDLEVICEKQGVCITLIITSNEEDEVDVIASNTPYRSKDDIHYEYLIKPSKEFIDPLTEMLEVLLGRLILQGVQASELLQAINCLKERQRELTYV